MVYIKFIILNITIQTELIVQNNENGLITYNYYLTFLITVHLINKKISELRKF